MKNEMKEFLAEGFRRYKQAYHVISEFSTNTQNELQDIIIKRKNWGSAFKPKELNKVKSYKYGDPGIFNAQIEGTIEGKPATLRISVNWFQSESDYPFYEIWFYDGPESAYEKTGSFKTKGRIEMSGADHRGLKMYPDPNDFDLERDYNALIDEFVRTISI